MEAGQELSWKLESSSRASPCAQGTSPCREPAKKASDRWLGEQSVSPPSVGIRIRIHIQRSRKVWWLPVNPALRRPGQVVPRTSSLDRLAGLGELQAQPEPAQYIRWRATGEDTESQISHTDTSEPPHLDSHTFK